MHQYDPRLAQAAAQLHPKFIEALNHLAANARVSDRRLEEMAQQVSDLRGALGAVQMSSSEPAQSGVIRIEDIPGRRIPYTLLVDIPIGANVTSKQQQTATITQEGPFVAVRRIATFQSAATFSVTDPDNAAAIGRFSGRSYGRYRPIHSAWDLNDGKVPSGDPAWWYLSALNAGVPVGTRLPSGILSMPSSASSFRTMEFDGRILVSSAGSEYPRQNLSVPSSFWSEAINAPWTLGCLDFMERGSIMKIEVQPLHVNNPPYGNVQGSEVFPAVAGLGAAAGWPFVAGQFDPHEGIATVGASTLGAATPDLPTLLDTDGVQRLPDGILTIGWEGYRIIQTIGPVG